MQSGNESLRLELQSRVNRAWIDVDRVGGPAHLQGACCSGRGLTPNDFHIAATIKAFHTDRNPAIGHLGQVNGLGFLRAIRLPVSDYMAGRVK